MSTWSAGGDSGDHGGDSGSAGGDAVSIASLDGDDGIGWNMPDRGPGPGSRVLLRTRRADTQVLLRLAVSVQLRVKPVLLRVPKPWCARFFEWPPVALSPRTRWADTQAAPPRDWFRSQAAPRAPRCVRE